MPVFQASSLLLEDAMVIEAKFQAQVRAVLAERREKGKGGMENRAELAEALLKTRLQTPSE